MRERLIMLAKEAKKEKRLHPIGFDEPDVSAITKSDWVGLRLLSLLLSTDPSNASIKDVVRSLDHYSFKYSTDVVLKAFALLTRERTEKDVWHNPESHLIRGLNRNMKATDNGRVL